MTVPAFPRTIEWWEWGFNSPNNRYKKIWQKAIALAETDTTFLVWRAEGTYEGHPRFQEIQKDKVKVPRRKK